MSEEVVICAVRDEDGEVRSLVTFKHPAPESRDIPDDVLGQAKEILAQEYGETYPTYARLSREGMGDFTMCSVRAVALAIVAERDKAEKLADEMYLTGIHDAYAWAKRWGHQDFAERLVREVNERAEKSGLPRLEVRR